MAAGDQCVAFANRGVATIAGAGSTAPTVTSFAVMKDLEIAVSYDHVPLYGWGSVRRQGVAKHSEKVSVKIGSMKFNPNPIGAFARQYSLALRLWMRSVSKSGQIA